VGINGAFGSVASPCHTALHCFRRIFGAHLVGYGSCGVPRPDHRIPVYFDAKSRRKSDERIHRYIFGEGAA